MEFSKLKSRLLLFIGLLSLTSNSFSQSDQALSLNYTVEKDEQQKGVYHFYASITNHTNETVYFLSESCNGLDYYITTTSPQANVEILMHCNATFPRKLTIAPGKSHLFKVRIRCMKSISNLGLNLTFIQLSKNYSIDDKFIGTIKQERKAHIKILKGPIVPLR